MKKIIAIAAFILVGGIAYSAVNSPPATSQNKIQVSDSVQSGYPDVIQFSTGSFSVDGGIFNVVIVAASNSAPRTNVTPNVKGQIIFNTQDSELCFSTGTVASSWVKVSTPSAACAH